MNYDMEDDQDQEEVEDSRPVGRGEKGKSNVLPIWGNEKTMNLNNLILTNIQSSHYFKVNLYELKTYHEVIDEIYYNVKHLEPWEKGSRKTSGQTGMCGGVRGVGAGGIVSTAFCLLYKLFTLKLTRKQLNGLLNHPDSPYIRSLGFMYIRYTQPPQDLWDWFFPYLDDEEEVECKAGGGNAMKIGEMLRNFMSKLEWFSTLFPRIPVPIQKDFEKKLAAFPPKRIREAEKEAEAKLNNPSRPADKKEAPKVEQRRSRERDRERDRGRHENGRDFAEEIAREKERQAKNRSGSKDRNRSRERHRSRSRDRKERHDKPLDRHTDRKRSRSRERRRSKSRERIRNRSRERHGSRSRDLSRDRKRKHRHHHSERGNRR